MSEGRPRIVLALTPIAERAIESALFGEQAPVVPVSSVAEADELEREAADSDAAAALVSPQLSGLTGGHCARARATGLRLVGLALDERDREALNSLGIDRTVTSDAPPGELAGALGVERRASLGHHVPRPSDPVREPERTETVVAVVGSKGASGASECAASLAALACARWPTLLVELDALGGDLDLRVGADPHRGSLLGVLRAAESDRRGAVGELLERWLVRAQGWPPLLLGPPDAREARDELAAAGAISGALRALAQRFPVVVCDVGFPLSGGDGAGSAERIHREAIVSAAAVLVVIGAREGQLRHGLDQLHVLVGDLGVAPERIRVIVNGVGVPGAPPRAVIEDALAERLAERDLAVDAWLAWDRRAARRAVRAGVPLAVAHLRGPYARAVGGLIDELFVPTRPATRTRRHLPAASTPPRTQAAKQSDEEVPLPWRA